MTEFAADADNEVWYALLTFPTEAHYIKYYFVLRDRKGVSFCFNEYGFSAEAPETGFFELLQANTRELYDTPDWAKGIVYYQIFPERFENSGLPKSHPLEPWTARPTRENFLGGDLRGILSRLDYLKDLGAECIYLNPIFLADFNHKYATTDYFRIDPDFGTEEDLVSLVKEAHSRGIRIILDGVFNHCGIHFSPFMDVREKGPESGFASWFMIREYPVRIDPTCYEFSSR